MSSNMAELHKDLMKEKEIREELSSELDQLRSRLRETEQNLQSTFLELAANVTLHLKTLLQQAELKWTADIQELSNKRSRQTVLCVSEHVSGEALTGMVGPDSELKRQKEVDSSLQDELSEQKATDNQLMADVLRLKEGRTHAPAKSVSFHAWVDDGPYKARDTLTAYRTINNDGNAYNETSGMFTVPVSGTYIFLANVIVAAYSPRKINDGVFIYVDGKVHGRNTASVETGVFPK
nr:hypothetical protein BaRGS_028335 [Batillaria attramentaria]